MDHLTAHLRQRRVPVFPSFPAEHQPTYHKALEHFGHGQFATSSATLLSIPSEFNTYPSYVILRVRTLLAQGYYHNAIRYLRETIDMIDEREAEILKTGGGGIINGALGGAPPQIDASDEMMRDTWKLWIKVLYWDDEGMSSLENRDGRRKEWVGEALRAWKDWCEWTAIEGYSEVHVGQPKTGFTQGSVEKANISDIHSPFYTSLYTSSTSVHAPSPSVNGLQTQTP